MTIMTSFLPLVFLLSSQVHSFPQLKRDALTIFVDARGSTCPVPTQQATYYVQPVVYSNHFDSRTVIDPFQNCEYITISNVPTDLIASTLYTTTILPNSQTILPLVSNSCFVTTTTGATVSATSKSLGKGH